MQPMQFKNWVESERGRSGALAVYLKVPPSFVSKMVSGEKPIPVTHMAGIEAFSNSQVTRKEMRPDDWRTIWPELATLAVPAPPLEKLPDHVIVEAIKANLIKDRRVFVRRAEDRNRLGLDISTALQGS
jgi:DNA-binding transcriptional regulator YdaS (Cro superfamily)